MELADLSDSLKRALAVPGEFDTFFPETSGADLSGMLADAVAECQLDGFLGNYGLNLINETVTPDLSTAQQALVILYARARVLQSRIANLKNRTRYKAGTTEAETEQSASVLVELLKETKERKREILENARYGSAGIGFSMVDMYVAKSVDVGSSLAEVIRVPLETSIPSDARF